MLLILRDRDETRRTGQDGQEEGRRKSLYTPTLSLLCTPRRCQRLILTRVGFKRLCAEEPGSYPSPVLLLYCGYLSSPALHTACPLVDLAFCSPAFLFLALFTGTG